MPEKNPEELSIQTKCTVLAYLLDKEGNIVYAGSEENAKGMYERLTGKKWDSNAARRFV